MAHDAPTGGESADGTGHDGSGHDGSGYDGSGYDGTRPAPGGGRTPPRRSDPTGRPDLPSGPRWRYPPAYRGDPARGYGPRKDRAGRHWPSGRPGRNTPPGHGGRADGGRGRVVPTEPPAPDSTGPAGSRPAPSAGAAPEDATSASPSPAPRKPALSAREVEVLLCWFQSESKTAVSEKLGLAPGTVSTYLSRIRIKYELAGRTANSKAALVARAVQDGLVTLDEL